MKFDYNNNNKYQQKTG
uniref:UORF n=1 Tax=Trypanosoma cruzi TaxID=5693 RepID=A0A076JK16_TRYCR|nr:uORF [Trypanosoma cruzi]